MLDTDTTSYLVKGRAPRIEARLAALRPTDVCISIMTRVELLYGLKRLAPSHLLHASVREFLRIVRALAWGVEAADQYAGIRHQLVTSGQPIGDMDMMIAAHALAVNAVLVTNNTKHFERIAAPLMMVNWVAN
jgi:tRNA(fMet)-specific endonuclease VapC